MDIKLAKSVPARVYKFIDDESWVDITEPTNFIKLADRPDIPCFDKIDVNYASWKDSYDSYRYRYFNGIEPMSSDGIRLCESCTKRCGIDTTFQCSKCYIDICDVCNDIWESDKKIDDKRDDKAGDWWLTTKILENRKNCKHDIIPKEGLWYSDALIKSQFVDVLNEVTIKSFTDKLTIGVKLYDFGSVLDWVPAYEADDNGDIHINVNADSKYAGKFAISSHDDHGRTGFAIFDGTADELAKEFEKIKERCKDIETREGGWDEYYNHPIKHFFNDRNLEYHYG